MRRISKGFEISGHSDYAEEGSDIVCAAVSSAALMTANTITEVQSLQADITENDGFLSLNLSQGDAKTAEVILNGLLLHLNAFITSVFRIYQCKNYGGVRYASD